MTRILGVDLGTKCTGWAIWDTELKRLDGVGEVDCSVRNYEGAGMRLFRFDLALHRILALHPDVVVYELVRDHRNASGSQNIDAAHVYGELRGHLLWIVDSQMKLAVTGIGVGQWKKAATGKGNTNKADVLAWARNAPGWPRECRSNDIADAVGVAVGFARTEL